ncbi:MAG: homoserine kinase [Acidobacteriota bacterium]|jgi:homoserine kinase|nr:homoserine kinase [Acidobacteriota bacterium]
MKSATVFVPASIGNVGPGFDVLGLAIDGIGDRVSIELRESPRDSVTVSGRDAEQVPTEATRNVAAVAARAFLDVAKYEGGAAIHVEKGLALSGGMGGSAASSVGGAAAASFALFDELRVDDVIRAALAGEALVSGRHLDNILPQTIGGLALTRSVDPLDYVALAVRENWWAALVTPAVRVETRSARSILSMQIERAVFIEQMANVAAMVHAFANGDGALLRRALDDRYAEPARKTLIPHFDDVKRAALDAGSIGCSISGSGPTVFAIAENEAAAQRCGDAMARAFGSIASTTHCGPIAREGARRI